MRGNIWSIIFVILLVACEKDKAVNQRERDRGDLLSVVKVKQGNNEIILNTIDYYANGSVKTRVGYNDYSAGLISSTAEYKYRDDKLEYVEEQINYGAGVSSNATVHSRSGFVYDAEGNVIQKNYYLYRAAQYELKSFTTFTYNMQGLPAMENRYAADGALTGYSIYEYDGKGNVRSAAVYSINSTNLVPVLISKTAYTYDSGLNPYRNIYAAVENIPFSVNRNNVVQTRFTSYAEPAVCLQPATTQAAYIYNKSGYPSSLDENGNRFFLEYQ